MRRVGQAIHRVGVWPRVTEVFNVHRKRVCYVYFLYSSQSFAVYKCSVQGNYKNATTIFTLEPIAWILTKEQDQAKEHRGKQLDKQEDRRSPEGR